MDDAPNFAAWSLENLAKFAAESYTRLQQQEMALEQLRLDRKTAMEELRKHKDDWK